MSEQFEKKKQAAQKMRQLVFELEGKSESSTSNFIQREKYDMLLKRYQEIEKVFNFQKDLLQNMTSGLITTDLTGKITFSNRIASSMLGFSLNDIKNRNVKDFFADREEASELLTKILKEQVMFESYETYWLSAQKEPVPIGFSTALFNSDKKSDQQGIVIMFRNIGQVMNLRKQIERMDRLATLGELSAGIAHEIRNPLAGIKTSAQVLEESFSPGDFRSQLVSRIVKEIDRSNELLKKFFNFAKPSRPKQEFHDIEMIIDGVYLLLAPRLKKKNIHFKTQFLPKTPQVYVDVSQIEQVILNVFLNAVEAINNGGEIAVETTITENIKLDESGGETDAVCIQIIDNGVGVPPEKLEKIFNPFYTSKSDGVGLGLSISSRLLLENGGKIEVESEEGKGSTFKIFLPVLKH